MYPGCSTNSNVAKLIVDIFSPIQNVPIESMYHALESDFTRYVSEDCETEDVPGCLFPVSVNATLDFPRNHLLATDS